MVSKEREVAIEAVLKACKVCQKVFNTLVKGETVIKADESPVTIGDFASQAIVSITLKKYFPDFKLVGEENSQALKESESLRKRVTGLVNDALETKYTEEDIMKAIDRGTFEGGSTGNFWVIDPIDGTKGFLRGGQYAVCLGYTVNGEVTLGVLGCPNLPCDDMNEEGPRGCLFIGEKGLGAFQRNFGSEKDVPIHVSSIDNTAKAKFCESFEAAHSSHKDSAEIAKLLNITLPPIRIDSQCKYGIIARGNAQVYLRFPREGYIENTWDHAAGSLIVKEAGGIVCDMFGKPLDFSQGRKLSNNKGVIATNGIIHNQVMNAIKSVFKLNNVLLS